MKKFVLITFAFILLGCLGDKDHKKTCPEVSATFLPKPPKNIVDSILVAFPKAVPVHTSSDSLLKHLKTTYGILPNQILLGASTCVDDIIYTKNFHTHPEIKGPFHLGGLAGLPFTGISGLEAFAHHIPNSGTMLLLIEPHVGISEKSG